MCVGANVHVVLTKHTLLHFPVALFHLGGFPLGLAIRGGGRRCKGIILLAEREIDQILHDLVNDGDVAHQGHWDSLVPLFKFGQPGLGVLCTLCVLGLLVQIDI